MRIAAEKGTYGTKHHHLVDSVHIRAGLHQQPRYVCVAVLY